MIGAFSMRSPIRVLIDRAALRTGVSAALILGPDRTVDVSRVRFAVAWAAHTGFGASNEMIARRLGRHPATITHARQRAEALREFDPGFRKLSDALLAIVREIAEPAEAAA